MKKQFLFATLALATMFTACSKEEELSKNESGTPVNFVIGGVGARTVTTLGQDGAYSTVFKADDEIGIYASGGADITNSKYTVVIDAVDANEIANKVKYFPNEWITNDGNDVTQDAIEYCLPLIQGEQNLRIKNGLPQHYVLRFALEHKKREGKIE